MTGCDDHALLIQAELDGELDAAAALALAAHVEGCAACAALRAELAGLSARLRSGVTRHAAPVKLRRAVAPRRLPRAFAASFAGGLAVAGTLALALLPRSGAVDEVVSAHIRALQPGHLMDVVSTDQHTVKPWFAGRLDFAPPVTDLSAEGFPLIGGRLDYVAGRPVAVLVYRRAAHVIDLFVWPGTQSASRGEWQGYNSVSWSGGGMEFRAVSDLNRDELTGYADLIRHVIPSR